MTTIRTHLPTVQGRCPACGHGLFLGSGGYVTCSWLECPNPCAATDLLERPAVPTAGPDRIPLDHLTSDQLDHLYEQIDRVRAAVADVWIGGEEEAVAAVRAAINGPKEN